MRTRSLLATFVVLALLAGLSGRTVEGAEKAPAKKLDVKYVTDDFYGAVIFHPRQLAESPAAAPLLKELKQAGLPAALDPRRIEQAVMLIPVPPQEWVPDGNAPSFAAPRIS